MHVEVPLIVWKDKPTMLKRKIKKNPLFCWHIKEKVKRQIRGIMCGFKNMSMELDES